MRAGHVDVDPAVFGFVLLVNIVFDHVMMFRKDVHPGFVSVMEIYDEGFRIVDREFVRIRRHEADVGLGRESS